MLNTVLSFGLPVEEYRLERSMFLRLFLVTSAGTETFLSFSNS